MYEYDYEEEYSEDYSDIHPDFLNHIVVSSLRYRLLVIFDFLAKIIYYRWIPSREKMIRTDIETLLFVNYQKSVSFNLFLGCIFVLLPFAFFFAIIVLSFIDVIY